MAGDAENEEDALEKFELPDPDIVLTDICMPYMDGLTLAARIHDIYPSVKVEILSGYDEFEYAKEAIRHNVIEYILKPVNASELTAILLGIKIKLDEELVRERNIDALRDSFQRNLPKLREHFGDDLSHDRVDCQRIEELLRAYQIDLKNSKMWTVAHVVIDEQEDIDPDSQLSLNKKKELLPLCGFVNLWKKR